MSKNRLVLGEEEFEIDSLSYDGEFKHLKNDADDVVKSSDLSTYPDSPEYNFTKPPVHSNERCIGHLRMDDGEKEYHGVPVVEPYKDIVERSGIDFDITRDIPTPSTVIEELEEEEHRDEMMALFGEIFPHLDMTDSHPKEVQICRELQDRGWHGKKKELELALECKEREYATVNNGEVHVKNAGEAFLTKYKEHESWSDERFIPLDLLERIETSWENTTTTVSFSSGQIATNNGLTWKP